MTFSRGQTVKGKKETIKFFFKKKGITLSYREDFQELTMEYPPAESGTQIPNETERKGLVTSRIGQGAYRKSVLHHWKFACVVIGYTKHEILIASHKVNLSFGRTPAGRAIRCKSSLVPLCGLSATIPHGANIWLNYRQQKWIKKEILPFLILIITTLSSVSYTNRYSITFTMPGNAKLFQESITKELDIIKNRVRNLIGDAHWGEEGRFKEAVLKNILRQFLPKNLSVSTGFILKATGNNDNDNLLSSQLDIIVYDNTLPVLFSEGDFVITTLKNVKAVIEVKSRITPTSFARAIEQFENSIVYFADEIRKPFFSVNGRPIPNRKKIFTGIFAFEFGGNINSNNIDNCLKDSNRIINHISLGPNHFIKYWKNTDGNRLAIPVECQSDFYNVYNLDNLSFSYFISNLVDITSGGLNDRYWFSFPIQGTKEIHRERTICLD